MNRAYSLLTVKSVSEDQRIIEGIATTPETDRMGDIVVPEGAQFKLPIPLLWQHDSSQPIGHVTHAKVTPKGIEIKASVKRVDEPGKLKDRLDEAWGMIKHGLVQGLSIGFSGMDVEPIKGTFGTKFLKWLWLELSAVTIPANGGATIQQIRSIATQQQAASGNAGDDDAGVTPGVSGKATDRVKGAIKLNPENKRSSAMDIGEQTKAYEDSKSVKAGRMAEIMKSAADRGETLTAEETAEYDGLVDEVKALDSHIKRLADLEKFQMATAKPVAPSAKSAPSEVTRDPARHTMVKAPPKPEQGIRFARYVKCLGLAQGNRFNAAEVAKQLYADRDPELVNVMKANVVAGATVSGNWAENLVGDETSAFADFVEYLRPMTILGKFGTAGVPSLRRVPFRVALVGQTAAGTGYWVGEGKPKPLTSANFSRTTLTPLKVANIAVLTEEIIRDSSPSAEAIIRDELAAALRERLDTDFVDPTLAASAGVSPASILNGISAIPSTGNTADDVREDVRQVMAAFIAANNAPTSGVWIMPTTTALALSLLVNTLGQPEFPGINMMGGTFFGLPVITSEYMPTVSAGAYVALVNAQDIYFADEGGIAVDMSREASLQMLDNPTNDTVTPTATTMVSMFQTNSVAFRAERTVNWARRRSSAVSYLSGVNWGIAS